MTELVTTLSALTWPGLIAFVVLTVVVGVVVVAFLAAIS